MKFDEHPIPKSVVLAWCGALVHLADATARSLANEQGLGAGFRANKIPADVARTRLRSVLEGSSELPEPIRQALRGLSHASALTVPLSDELIKEQSGLLTKTLGFAETIAALLLDGRSSLRTHALEMLAVWDGCEADEEERHLAKEELRGKFQDLAQAMKSLSLLSSPQSLSGHGHAQESASDMASSPSRPPRLQSERQLVIALRDKRREANLLSRELANARQEVDRLHAALEALKPAQILAQRRAEHAERELAERREYIDSQVHARVESLLDERLLPWLVPAQSLAQAAEDSRGKNLLEQAELLLQDQAAIDRRYGLRCSLQAELESCHRMLTRLAEAQTESLRPLPQLGSLQHALRLRSQTLIQQLGTSSETPTAPNANLARLQESIRQADTLEKLRAVRQALNATEPLGWLDADERAQAYALLADLASRIYARQGICRTAAQDREGLRNLPLYAMQSTLALGHPATLVVDGHNVLFTLPTLFRPFFDKGIPGIRAREALEHRLVALAKRHPHLRVQLWFDGEAPGERTVADNFRVNFSGGSGSNRADRQILAFLRHLKIANPNEIRAVVTADQEEARAAEHLGAMVMAPEELAIWLG